jgi:F-type H+-transporting ATPase subunit b
VEHTTSILAEPRFWVAVAFFAFFIIFGRRIFAPLLAILDRRAATIRAQLDEAGRLRAEAEAMLRDAQARRETALREAQDIVERARGEAARAADQARADAEAASRRRERMATDRIQAAEAAAVAEVRRAAVDVATQAATRLLQGGLGAEVDTALVDRSIAALPAALTGRRAA